MAIDFNAVAEELQDLCATVWPDIVRPGDRNPTYLAEHIGRIPFEELTNGGMPYAVVVMPEPRPADLGLHNRCFYVDCELLWIGPTSGPATVQRQRAEAMAAHLTNTDAFSTFQVWDDPHPTPSAAHSMPINETLLAKKEPVLVGRCSARLVVGEEIE